MAARCNNESIWRNRNNGENGETGNIKLAVVIENQPVSAKSGVICGKRTKIMA
jgi:hypothetical protein